MTYRIVYNPKDEDHPPNEDGSKRKVLIGANEFTEGEPREFTIDQNDEGQRLFLQALQGNHHFEVKEGGGYEPEEDDEEKPHGRRRR